MEKRLQEIASGRVYNYFKKISEIPRETGKEKEISDFLVQFAKDRGLEVIQDEVYNIIIKKKSTIRNCTAPGVILQGHMDMVYQRENDSGHNYNDGIKLVEREGYIYGEGTTLGADNGIALAYFLAILDSDNIKHPDLEIVITTQEEGGLVGVRELDTTTLKGKFLINMDAEEEGVLFTSCAGGIRSLLKIPIETCIKEDLKGLEIKVKGLKGGHSGLDIDKERGNAIKLMGRLLLNIESQVDYFLASINCNGKANAIPRECSALLYINLEDEKKIRKAIREVEGILIKELMYSDGFEIEIHNIRSQGNKVKVYNENIKDIIIKVINLIPNGVINRSCIIEDLVQTSLNWGAISSDKDNITILGSIRSSLASQKYNLVDRIKILAEIFSLEHKTFNDYPQWEYKEGSILREITKRTYERLFNKKVKLAAIHGGLECGYLDQKLHDVDIISLGPDIFNVHTTEEHASTKSISNIYILLINILEELIESSK